MLNILGKISLPHSQSYGIAGMIAKKIFQRQLIFPAADVAYRFFALSEWIEQMV